MSDATTPAVGAKAPAFNLPDQTGTKVRLSSFQPKPVFVYFYPKAMTPGCTTQAQGLSAIADDVGDTMIIGISPDAPERLARFDEKHDLGFTLLSDEDHAIAEKYGVWVAKKMYGKEYMGVQRSAFLIDGKGKVAAAWPKISPKATPDELLAALKEL